MRSLFDIVDYARPIRSLRRLMARRHGEDAVVDGRLSVITTTALLNWLFQRVLGQNHACRFPVHFTSRITRADRLEVGKNVVASLASNGGVYIQAHNGVRLGDDVLVAAGVKIISANHEPGRRDAWVSCRPITVGARAWIGANAVILPGVSIGEDAVIGAGAVVTRDIPALSVAVGSPARVVHRRDSAVGTLDEQPPDRSGASAT